MRSANGPAACSGLRSRRRSSWSDACTAEEAQDRPPRQRRRPRARAERHRWHRPRPTWPIPRRPITFVVPFAAGGPTDTVTRLVAEPMSATLGQQIVVQNVAGAGGTLAAGQVADGCAGRLHGAHAPHRDVDRPVAVRGPAVRPARRLQDDRPRHRGPDDDHRPEGPRAEHAPGARRLREGEPGDRDLRERRHRRGIAPLRPALHERHRHQGHRGPVRRNGAGDGGPRRQPGRLHVRPDDEHDRADQRGQRSRPTRSRARSGTRRCRTCRRRPRRGLPDVQVSVWHGLYVPTDTPDEVVQALTAALKAALTDQNVIDEVSPSWARRRSPRTRRRRRRTRRSSSPRSSSGGRSSRRPA